MNSMPSRRMSHMTERFTSVFLSLFTLAFMNIRSLKETNVCSELHSCPTLSRINLDNISTVNVSSWDQQNLSWYVGWLSYTVTVGLMLVKVLL